MVLSETRGLLLFRVVRGGIGSTRWLGAQSTLGLTYQVDTLPRTRASTRWLGAQSTLGLTYQVDTLPRTRASQEPDWPPPGTIPEMERALREALKLLVVSDVRRRNVLLSSRRSK